MSVMELEHALEQLNGSAPELPRQLVDEMRDLHRCGEPTGAQVVLARHPEITADKALLTDLASEEFKLRQAAGETVDYVAFSAQFPEINASLRAVLALHIIFNAPPPNQALPPPETGDALLGFHLLHELGRGSFAYVFLAQETAVGGRHVVAKFSAFRTATDATGFGAATEATALGSLSHPNIVPILSLHTNAEAGWTAVCMPYHGTATLADVFKRLTVAGTTPRRARAILEAIADVPLVAEPMPEGVAPPEVLRRGSYLEGALHICAQLADAVAYVHKQKICHRDLKPANVLLTPNGRPLLLDFNLSCTETTATRDVGGTLPHMAPEQIRAYLDETLSSARDVDSRSDVFALGVLLYQLLTGKHPFTPLPKNLPGRAFALWLLKRQEEGAPPVRTLNPQIDHSVAQLVDRSLSFDPSQRPAAYKLVEALRHAQRPSRRAARSLRAHAKSLLAIAALTLFAVLYTVLAPLFAAPANLREVQAAEQAYRQGHYKDAVKHYSEVLKLDGESATVLLARGRAYFHLNELDDAKRDFRAADKLSKDGKAKAALATCYLIPGPGLEYNNAACLYEAALDAHYRPAWVYNNLGYSEVRCAQFAKARHYLTQAIERDPSLGAAHHNRAVLMIRNLVIPSYRKIRFVPLFGQPLPVPLQITVEEYRGNVKATLALLRRQVLPDLNEAVVLGPESAELHLDAARAYGLAAQLSTDPKFAKKTLYHVSRAIDLGCNPKEFRREWTVVAGLVDHEEEFGALLRRPAVNSPTTRAAVRFVTPLDN